MKIKLGPALKISNSTLMFRNSQDVTEDGGASGPETRGQTCSRTPTHTGTCAFRNELGSHPVEFNVPMAILIFHLDPLECLVRCVADLINNEMPMTQMLS